MSMDKWSISTANFESDLLNPGLSVSPWCGHRNFIYDYLNFIKPERVIELGTHYGCSFFAMCQSMKDNKLDIKLYAVDTWKGDEQAGFYGEEVWNIVNKTKQEYYSKQNTEFVRMLFSDAAKKFENESFDLIHIDGLHTYDAVSEDFKTWLPKLKENGVMMFHDIASQLNYGTNTFWKEIKEQYNCYFEFDHSWGLGILFPKGNKIQKIMQNSNFEDKLQIYKYKALYQYETIKTKDLTQMANERYAAIQKQTQMIDERDIVIEAQKELVDEKDEGIKKQTQMIDERDLVIEDQKKLIAERDEIIKQQSFEIRMKSQKLKEIESAIEKHKILSKIMFRGKEK